MTQRHSSSIQRPLIPTWVKVPVILDVEASGFDPFSYPIEIGVVMENGERFSRLILPYDDWTHWSKEAESVHQISRDDLLLCGKPGKQVAEELNEWLSGKTIYSDGWVVDKPWLIKLFDRAQVKMDFWLSPLEMILSESLIECWEVAEQQAYEDIHFQRHRASIDAFRIQHTYINAQLLNSQKA